MIGFEFETAALLNWAETGAVPDKQAAIMSSRAGTYFPHAWEIASDSGKLEVVTEPFDDEAADQTAERARLVAVFQEIYAVVDMIKDLGEADADQTARITDAELGNTARLAALDKGALEVLDPSDASLAASPQATIGFTMDRIAAAARSIVDTELSIFEEAEHSVRSDAPAGTSLSGMHPIQGQLLREAALRARAEVMRITEQLRGRGIAAADLPPTAAYEGFLTIVFSYLLMGRLQDEEWAYYKLIAPLMSRVSLHVMYQDPEVQDYAPTYFTPANVFAACEIDNGATDGSMLYRRGVRGRANIPRTEWIASIRAGQDRLAAFDAAFESGSMSKLDAANYFAPDGKKLYQLELRRLPQVILPEAWGLLALDLYKISRQWRIRMVRS
jgi:hypothetical protein